MIKLNQVSKIFGTKPHSTTALDKISLHVKRQSIYGIIGSSGAGKSTLIRCVNLLEKPTSGEVIVDNQSLINLNACELRRARQKIGMIFQHFNLMSNQSVYENTALPLKLLGMKATMIRAKVNPILEITGLSDKTNRYPAELSGGQKQRVAIARALTTEPKVLLCDEATSALDPETTHSILTLLKNLNTQLDLTIMLITHEMEVVKSICDHVAVLNHGRLIETNNVSDFFLHPKTDEAKALVSSVVHEKSLEYIRKSLALTEKGDGYPVIRIVFVGNEVGEAYLTKIARQYTVDFNILQADVEMVAGKALGFLTAEIKGQKAPMEQALNALEEFVQVEVLGYVG